MDLNTAINERFSCRKFYPDRPVTREQIEEIISAGWKAPNATNAQLIRFHVVTKASLLREISENIVEETVKQWNSDFISRREKLGIHDVIYYNAPCVIFVTFIPHPSFKDAFSNIDVGLCVENMVLKAHSMGLSSLINGLTLLSKDFVSKKLELHEDEVLAVAVCFGTKHKEIEAKQRDRNEPSIKFIE